MILWLTALYILCMREKNAPRTWFETVYSCLVAMCGVVFEIIAIAYLMM
jgi:hypothetical protein